MLYPIKKLASDILQGVRLYGVGRATAWHAYFCRSSLLCSLGPRPFAGGPLGVMTLQVSFVSIRRGGLFLLAFHCIHPRSDVETLSLNFRAPFFFFFFCGTEV
jgi:hypothetical protein